MDVLEFMAAQRKAEEAAAEAQEKARLERLADYRTEVETLFGAEVIAALEPAWGFSESWRAGYPSVVLHYRGRQREVVQGEKNFSTRAGLARWLQAVDAEIDALAQSQAEFLAALPAATGEVTDWNGYRTLAAAAKGLDLLDDPLVSEPLAAVKARLEEQAHQRQEALVASVVAQYQHVTDWVGYGQIDDYFVLDDDRVIAARQSAHDWLTELTEAQHKEEEQRYQAMKGRMEAAQKAAFFPFCYYEIRYGLVALDEAGDNYVAPERLLVLHADPAEGGWYITIDGRRVRVLHPATVERIECLELDQLPVDAPLAVTEDGMYYRVPPVGAERLC